MSAVFSFGYTVQALLRAKDKRIPGNRRRGEEGFGKLILGNNNELSAMPDYGALAFFAP